MSAWNRIWKPVVVLTLICVVVSGALAVANRVTAPIIEDATRRAQEAARLELLPEAEGFKRMLGYEVEGVSEIYVAESGGC